LGRYFIAFDKKQMLDQIHSSNSGNILSGRIVIHHQDQIHVHLAVDLDL
jgi:hypothetical protein